MTIEARPPSYAAAATSFDDFYRTEYGAMVRLVWSLTGRRDIAEELVQDAFITLHRKWPQVSGYDKPGAWMRRIVVHRCYSQSRRVSIELRGLTRIGSRRTVSDEPTDDATEIWAALRKLPRRQQEVMGLVVADDRSVAEVAQILQCDENPVRTHLRRGRQRLAELLGEAHDDGGAER